MLITNSCQGKYFALLSGNAFRHILFFFFKIYTVLYMLHSTGDRKHTTVMLGKTSLTLGMTVTRVTSADSTVECDIV